MLKFSIITVTYNAGNLLRGTIESVLCQIYSDYEYIIIDGGSSDNTQEIVRHYNADKIIFLSEPDNGIYDAMNKGIKLAKGDYCMFLNAGDELFDNNVLRKAVHLMDEKEYYIFFGEATYVYRDSITKCLRPNLSMLPFTFCHQAMFFNTVMLKNNMYDVSYRFSGDSELVYRLYEKGWKMVILDLMMIRELGGEGATERNLMKSTMELYSIPYLKNNLSPIRINFNKIKIRIYCLLRDTKLIRK